MTGNQHSAVEHYQALEMVETSEKRMECLGPVEFFSLCPLRSIIIRCRLNPGSIQVNALASNMGKFSKIF